MKREYESGVAADVNYFVGTEVEHTPAYGKRTLFVVGVQPVADIKAQYQVNNCEHIYFGANMSFDVTSNDYDQWQPWAEMISPLLEQDILITLDVGVDQVEGLLEAGFVERHNFIPMVSVKLPYIQQLGYNACIKLDDHDMAATNPGVWVHRVHDLMDYKRFTSWDKYKQDQPV